MAKIETKSYPVIFPCPVVLVSAIDSSGKPNLITLAWVGNVCSEPPKVAISIRPFRYSYDLIKESGEFVVNVPKEDQLKETDWCGVVSGKDHNKFEEADFTPIKASQVKAPLAKECPVNAECKVEKIIPLGTHDLFIGKILTVHIDEAVIGDNNRPDYSKIKPIGFLPFYYFSIGEEIGTYGFTQGKL